MSGAGLLLRERQVAAQPSLVRAVGLLQAVVLQQIAWHLDAADDGIELDGVEWFPITCSRLASETGLSEDGVKRATRALEDRGLLVSTQPEGYASRRKWYRIEYDHDLLQGAKSPDPKGRNRPIPRGEIAPSTSYQPVEPLEPRELPLAREEKVSARRPRTAARPRRTDPRADQLVKVWWEAQAPRPVQPWPAAVGVVSTALRAGWEPETLAAALRTLTPPLSGGALDYALRHDRRPANAAPDEDWDRSEPSRVIQ